MKQDSEYIRKLYSTKLDCGKNLLELTTFNNITMWWAVHPMFANIVHSKVYFPGKRAKFLVSMYKIAGPFIQAVYDTSAAAALRLMMAFMGDHKSRKKNQIAFLTQDVEWRSNKKKDIFFDTTIEEIEKQSHGVLSFYPITLSPIRGLMTFIDKLKNWDVPHVPTEAYFGIDVYREYISAIKYFKKSWEIIYKDNCFKELCTEYGEGKYDEIMKHLQLYFIFLFPYLVRESKLFKNMIKNEKPNAIVMMNEYGWIERSYMVVAKAESVPVIAIQHGIIHPNHSGYIYCKSETFNGFSPSYCPIPDKTAVSGKYYYDLLTKLCGYPDNAVIITGQPRYDIFYNASMKFNKEKFMEKYKIKPNCKIIVWTTQCHGLSDKENDMNYDCIFKTIDEIDNIVLIIKQHPVEPDIYTNKIIDYIKKYSNGKVILVPKNYDTYELIFLGDLLITKTSTTAIEAAALNKPIIVLNLIGDGDAMGYVKEGIAVGVYGSDNLNAAISNLLSDASILSVAQKKYAANHLYMIDGKSSTRVADLILKAVS